MHSFMKSTFVLVVLLHAFPGAFAESQSGIIDEIRFSGNKATKENVMRQEMLVREGDPVDMGKIEKSRQGIMNLGLFKRVDAEVLHEEGSNVLLITVEERFYILPLPLLDANLEEEAYSYGMEVRHDNLMGLNQRLKLGYVHKKSANSKTPMRKESKLDYSYPRIFGSTENLSVSGRVSREDLVVEENAMVTGTYTLDNRSLAFQVSRWLGPESISQGWILGGGMAVSQFVFSHQQGSANNLHNSQALEVNASLSYSAVEEYPYHREGSAYGFGLSASVPNADSDYSYNRLSFYHRNYHVLNVVDASIHTQVILGLANGSSFGAPAFNIGGGRSLRGYESSVLQGNALFQLNAEYHHHLSGYRQLRGVVFMDVGNTWAGAQDVNLGKFYSSVGLGMRWRVQSFVDTTLRIDVAYGVDSQETKLYAATSSSF